MHEEEVGLLTHVSVLLGEELLESLLLVLLLLESAAEPGEPGLGCCPASVAGGPKGKGIEVKRESAAAGCVNVDGPGCIGG